MSRRKKKKHISRAEKTRRMVQTVDQMERGEVQGTRVAKLRARREEREEQLAAERRLGIVVGQRHERKV